MFPASQKLASDFWGDERSLSAQKYNLLFRFRKTRLAVGASDDNQGLTSLLQRYDFSLTWANNLAGNADGIDCFKKIEFTNY